MSIKLEVYDAGGAVEITSGHAPRLDTLSGKTIGLLSLSDKPEVSHAGFESARVLSEISELLKKQFPDIKIISYTELPAGEDNLSSEDLGEIVKSKGCNGVIVGNAACGTCATVCGRAAARVEEKGIPAFIVSRVGFPSLVNHAFAGLGFPAEAAAYAFPQEMFLPGSDLAPIRQNLEEIIDGLTKWQPAVKEKGIVTPPKISVEGRDYEEAITGMNNLFLKNLWGDGLPVLPPTAERVGWILTGTDLPPDTQVGEGRILPRGGIATVEMLAVYLAMAGGRPEYLPVLIAAVEGITRPSMRHDAWNTTTGCTTPLLIVNGPVARQIRINCGYGALGPSSEFPAGASIGRAVRFVLMNLGGAVPGRGSMSIFGGPGRYTSLVLAEDEDDLPAGWEPLNTEQGFPGGSNTLTVDIVGQYGEVLEGAAAATEEELTTNFKSMARFISSTFNKPSPGIPGYLLIGRSAAQQLAKLGCSKGRAKAVLWEHAGVQEPISKLARRISGLAGKEGVRWPMPITKDPEDIKIVVCGGAQAGHSYWLQAPPFREEPAAVEIKLPANWEQLIKKAEEDLGPVPTA